MKTTTRHIEYLSQIHDCVIITGLGAILAHHEQARMINGVMHAPRRVFTFNQGLTVSDGLLEESIAREKQVDIDAAQKIIEDDVRSMLADIAADGHSNLGIVGALQRDKSGALRLTSTNHSSASCWWSWMPDVDTADYALSIDETTADETAEIGTNKPVIAIKPYVTKVARYAAAAIVLLVIGFAASTPISVDKNTHLAALTPTVKSQQQTIETKAVDKNFVYVPSTKCPTIVLNYQDPQIIDTAKDTKPVEEKKETAAAEKPTTTQAPKAQAIKSSFATDRMVDSDSFCVIIASLTNAEDAEKCVDEGARKGKTYAVLQQGSRYRVYAATAPTKAQAQATLNSLAAKHPGAWICQR